MDKYGAFLFLFSICILNMGLNCKANDEERKVYIVYLGALPDVTYSPSSHHLSMLQGVIEGSSVENSLIRSYTKSFNGFVAKLTDQEKRNLAKKGEVVSIFPNKIFHIQTTRSWDFIGLKDTSKRNLAVESDTIVGVLDSGIWPESESFSDKGFGPPPKKWKGACKGGKNFTCNNKLIGARYYGMRSDITTSAWDEVGHGTHTASTAAGNYVKDASFYEIAKGTARGGVPSARIAAYKVCGLLGCPSAAILAGFDDAIADGVDVITISIGTVLALDFASDPIAIGAFHAMEKGILTLNSAGNSGPTLGTVSSVAPWMLSVAASSTDRRIIDHVVLGNGKTIAGNSVNSFQLNGSSFPLVHGLSASTQCSEYVAGSCKIGCLDKTLVKEKILACDSALNIVEALNAGALGVIYKSQKADDVSSVVPLPAIALQSESYLAVLSYIKSTSQPTGTILKSVTVKDLLAPKVASFSSRGPNIITPDVLKPDISAPGVEILAAYSPIAIPSSNSDDKRHVKYNILSGTSMACPHVAGAAAYVKTIHPDWSPSAVKSSLMTTAWVMRTNNGSNGEFDYGAGHVNPVKAISPGLVYEAFEEDYINLLCSIGLDGKKVELISKHNSSCPKGSKQGSPRDLNYPSMAAFVLDGSFPIKFHRKVKNVGYSNSTYKATIIPKTKFDIKVVPPVLSFKSLHEEKSFDVIVKGSSLPPNSLVSTSLVWSDGVHKVRSPIVLHNVFPQGFEN